MSWLLLLLTIALVCGSAPVFADDDERYLNCLKSFDCGNIKGYPFSGSDRPDYCGYPGFELGCSNQDPEITIMGSTYKLLGINSFLKLLIKVLSWFGVQMIHYVIHVNLLVVCVGTTGPLQHSLVTVRINLKILNAQHHHWHLVNQQGRSLETVQSKLDLAHQVLLLVPLWDAGSWPLYNGGEEKPP